MLKSRPWGRPPLLFVVVNDKADRRLAVLSVSTYRVESQGMDLNTLRGDVELLEFTVDVALYESGLL